METTFREGKCGTQLLGVQLVVLSLLRSSVGGITRCCCNSTFPLGVGGLHWQTASGSQSSFHVDVEPVCVTEREEKGEAEPLEVIGDGY